MSAVNELTQTAPNANQIMAAVLELYDQGRYIDAYEASRPLGDLTQWTSDDGLVMAGRMANNLGAPRLGRALHWRAARRALQHPLAAYFGALAYWSRFGTLHAWRKYRRTELPDHATNSVRADWLAMKALMLAYMRDFSRADQYMIEALELDPNSSWLHVQLCEVLDREDLHEEALKAAREALNLRPLYRPAVQSAGHKLVQLRRDDEALELLSSSAKQLQSGEVWCQLGMLQQELKMFDAAWESFIEAEKHWPLAANDSNHKQWLAGQRSDIAYYRKDYPLAIELAKQVDSPFYKRLVERLEKAASEPATRQPRIQLPVPFTRQHHDTCAPATLTAIAHYWKREVMHEEIVERICYEGTQGRDERRWAEENNFFAREFRITSEAADKLIRAGVPFSLNTVDPGSAHLQAIVGIDDFRGTFLIQDPSERHVGEGSYDKLLEHYANTGPRGMVMFPHEELNRIANIELPDAEIYDHHYEVDRALSEYRREDAQIALQKMIDRDPDHRLTLQSRMAINRYDGNPLEQLSLADKLLERFPDDANLKLLKLACLTELGQRDQRIAMLRESCTGEKTHPIFWARLASELLDDARDHEEAALQLRRALRYMQSDGRSVSLLGNLLWEHHQRDEALEVYRLAACLGEKDEGYARTYFSAARFLHGTKAALEFLEDRFRRFDSRSSLPGRTLAWAYEQLEESQRSLDLLDQVAAKHPDDGDLICQVAFAAARFNQGEKAAKLLAQAKGKTPHATFVRTSALVAHIQGKLQEARELFLEVQALDPLDMTVRERILSLDMDLDGNEVAEQRLREAVSQFPHSYSLRVLLIQWLRSNNFSAVEKELQSFLKDHPDCAWAQREAAIVAMFQSNLDEAERWAKLAIETEPNNEVGYFLLGKICRQRGLVSEARSNFRAAIQRNIDHDSAISALLETCDRPLERQQELQFVHEQLQVQTTFGDGVLAFREAAVGGMEPDQLLARLQEGLEHRPDLWQCYIAVVQQYMAMNQRTQAVEIAQQATEKFPLLPRVWLELALVHRALGDGEAELAALQRARDINPTWADVARELSEAYMNRDKYEDAEQVLRQMLQSDPRDPQTLANLADCLYRSGKKTAALEPLSRACLAATGYNWAWQSLNEWSDELDQGQTARKTAEQIAALRPHDARSFLRLAEAKHEIENIPEGLEHVERALELDPRYVDAHVLKAFFLGRLHRWDDALQACSPQVFGDDPPVALQMRKAYVLYRKGRMDEAIDAMQLALKADPDHYGAWSQLADWAEEVGNFEVYRTAAENLIRIDPHQPAPHGYLADAMLRNKDERAEAIEHLEKAIALAPNYNYGTMRLVDLYLEDNLPDEAQRVIDLTGEHVPDGYLPSMQIRISAKRKSKDEQGEFTAINQLIDWCRSEAPQSPLVSAIDAFDEDLHKPGVSRLKNEIVALPDCKSLGIALGRLHTRVCSEPEILTTFSSLPIGTAWHECFRVTLRSMPHFGKSLDLLQKLKQKFKKPIRENNKSWAVVSSTLLDYNQNKEVLNWTSDWQKREGLVGNDLIPTIACRWEFFKIAKARPAVELGLKLDDDAASLLHVWAGLDSLFQHNLPAALNHAQLINPSQLGGWYPLAYRILVSTCEVLLEGPQSLTADAKKEILAAFKPQNFPLENFSNDKLSKWLLWKSRALIAKHFKTGVTSLVSQLQAWWLQVN